MILAQDHCQVHVFGPIRFTTQVQSSISALTCKDHVQVHYRFTQPSVNLHGATFRLPYRFRPL